MSEAQGMNATEAIKLMDSGQTAMFLVAYATTMFLQLAKLRPKQKFIGVMNGQQLALSFLRETTNSN